LGVDVFPDGTAIGIGMVVAEVGMVDKIFPDGTAMVADTVVAEFMDVVEVILDGTAGIVIIAKVVVVSEVTGVNLDGKSMMISVAVLAPVSAITLEIRMSEATQAFATAVSLTAVSLSAWDPVWKSKDIGLPGFAVGIVIIAEVAVVSEVTGVNPDGKSMVISVAVLAPVSAITLEIGMSEATQAFATAVSLSAWDPVWKSKDIGLPGSCGMVAEMKFVANKVNLLVSTVVSEFLIYM
jgi:hypothetical protein